MTMGLEKARKEKMVPRYKPHEASTPKTEHPVFNETYLEHHNIHALKWKAQKHKNKDGDSDD